MRDFPRQCACGRDLLGDRVEVRWNGETAGFAGLETCGSAWACSVCNSKIMSRRALEVGLLLAAAGAQGRWLGLVTLTARHRLGEPLRPLWDDVSGSWRAMTKGRPWADDRAGYGIEGYIRAAEVTWGPRNGWHPHHHVALVGDRSKMPPERLARLHGRMFERWRASLVAAGRRPPLMAGQDARLVTAAEGLSDYLAKATDTGRAVGLGRELTQSQGKTARSRHATEPPWALVDRVLRDGDADALDLWHEYVRAAKGRQQITKSRGLAQLLGVELVEKSDEDIAAEELGSSADAVFWITRAGWLQIVREPILQPLLLKAFTVGGLPEALAFCAKHSIEIEHA